MLRGAAGVATGLTLMVERAQKVEKAKRKLMVSLGARLGRGFGRRRATELGQQWRMVALVAAMRGRRRERAREREREERRKWTRRGRRGRPGAPGGRPGRVQAGACAPRGCRALPARHGGTGRPVVARGRGRGEGDGAFAGWAGFGQRARSEAAAC